MPFKLIDPKPNFSKLEEQILKFWEENKIFEKSLSQTKQGKPYTFYDGPPFATGTPHYGHILASTIKDLIPRYQTMKGRFVRRRWGWDCHGLPIEEIVERKLGISGKKDIEKLGIKKFNETCRLMVLQFVDEWRKTIRRMARWIDFDNSYKTMDRDYMESVWWAFKQIYDQGLIYEGRRVLLYCPRCETPISNFEVAMDNSYKDVIEEAVTVKFKVKNPTTYNLQPTTYFLAWTTTPWTLPGNVALAVGKNVDYVKIEKDGELYIIAKERVAEVFRPPQDGNLKVSATFKGSELVGLEYEPLFDVSEVAKSDKAYKVYAADFVTTEDGTGVVHTAVVYGEDDYNLGLKEGLPVVPLLNEKGIFNDKAPELIRGKYFKDSEKLIKKDLEARGLMFAKKLHQHSYPHCWRCGTMLYYNAIPAWFMNIQKIKPGLLKTNDKQINWYPDHLKHGRYQKSVEAAPDWNISRNRYWGNPIPVWKCQEGHVTVVGSVRELGLSRNTFYFSRHAESKQNILNIHSNWPEKEVYDLTDRGLTEAKKLASEFKGRGGVDLIFASDLRRTKHTAEIVGKALGVEVKFDERLRELNVGEKYNNGPAPNFDRDYPERERWTKAPPDGETWQKVEERMVSFVEQVNKKYQGKKILVVSHGDPLYVLQQHFGSELMYPAFASPFELDVSVVDLHRPYIDEVVLKCEKCGREARRIPEIFDSWVEAGSMPFAEYHYPFDNKGVFPDVGFAESGSRPQASGESRFPAQFVSEYIAQTRAWFYVMHVIGYNLFGQAPFEHVVTTGTVLNEKGEKLSKSKKNYTDPWINIDKYGVDAIRLYLMNSPVMQSDDLFFSDSDLAITYRKNILILWNVYNYFVTYANEADWKSDSNPPGLRPPPLKLRGGQGGLSILDQWVLAKTQELINTVTDELDGYNTVRATRAIEDYIQELSTWYLRRSRGRKDAQFFATLHHCLLNLSKVIAPFMPYMAELIYQNLTGQDHVAETFRSPSDGSLKTSATSVHLTSWPIKEELSGEQKSVLANMQTLKDLVEQGHSLRKAANVRLRQPLSSFTYTGKKLSQEFEEILAEELNVKAVKLGEKQEFDLKVSSRLKQEGLARELERAVQELRKSTGLKVGEAVKLAYFTDDKELEEALKLLDRKKTYISEIVREKNLEGKKVELEGKKIVLRV